MYVLDDLPHSHISFTYIIGMFSSSNIHYSIDLLINNKHVANHVIKINDNGNHTILAVSKISYTEYGV